MMARYVVIDTESTGLVSGLRAGWADLIQVSMIVLEKSFKPDKLIAPFYCQLAPKHYEDTEEYHNKISEAMKINGLNIRDVVYNGFNPYKAASLFEEWWKRIGNEQVFVIAQNWHHDRCFLGDWLGDESIEHYFHKTVRDTQVAAALMNDRAHASGDIIPFPDGFGLKKLAKYFDIPMQRAHDAYSDCLTTAEVYRRLVLMQTVNHHQES